MGYEKELDPGTRAGEARFLVVVTDPNGSVVGRETFATQIEADAYAEAMRNEGRKAERSTLDDTLTG